MTVPFDIIFTSDDPNVCNVVSEYLKSSGGPDLVNPGVVNVYKGKYRHVVLPRLAMTAVGAPDSTKRYYWGMVSSTLSSFYLGMWEAPHMIAPTAGSNAEDVQTDDWDFRLRCGFGICVVGSTWLKFSAGDGTA